jgi:PAT family beta-lactamase induction signal transducer AmpG
VRLRVRDEFNLDIQSTHVSLGHMRTRKLRGAALPSPLATPERPWLFGLLIAPAAVLSIGIIGGALSYLLRMQGVGPARASVIIALLSLPHTIYFLWSPVTDFWMRRRTWLMLAAAAAATTLLIAFRQHNLAGRWAVGLIFFGACLVQFVVASCGGMMGTLKSEANRRRAGSFYQAGSLAFAGVAVLLLVLLSKRLQLGILGWLVAAMIAIPALAALAAPAQSMAAGQDAKKTLAQIWHEFKATFLRWEAIPYTLTILFPMGSGAMIALLPGLATDYGVSGGQVAWMNGLGGAVLMAAGALTATLTPVRVRAPVAYLLAALVNASTLTVLWLGPPRPVVYFTGTILFLYTIGACYALFTAVVLEFLGGSGKSGSARYSIINSLGNLPVAYMEFVDGRGYAHWGARGMPGTDLAVSAIGGSMLLAYFLSHRKKSETEVGEAVP